MRYTVAICLALMWFSSVVSAQTETPSPQAEETLSDDFASGRERVWFQWPPLRGRGVVRVRLIDESAERINDVQANYVITFTLDVRGQDIWVATTADRDAPHPSPGIAFTILNGLGETYADGMTFPTLTKEGEPENETARYYRVAAGEVGKFKLVVNLDNVGGTATPLFLKLVGITIDPDGEGPVSSSFINDLDAFRTQSVLVYADAAN